MAYGDNRMWLALWNSASLTLNGAIHNSGSFALNSSGNYTSLTLGSSVDLSGGGTVTLTQYARINGSGTLTNVDNTIAGETWSGSVGENSISIINQGTINANVSGRTLVLDPANTGTGLTNTGELEATNGGTLQLNGNSGGAFTNTGATIRADGSGSIVQLVNGTAITGGTLSGTNGGQFVLLGGHSASYNGVAHHTATTLQNSSTLTLSGAIDDTVGFTVASTGNYTDLVLNGYGRRLALGKHGTIVDSIHAALHFASPTLAVGDNRGFGFSNKDCVENWVITQRTFR